jgi:hypothetical protein
MNCFNLNSLMPLLILLLLLGSFGNQGNNSNCCCPDGGLFPGNNGCC